MVEDQDRIASLEAEIVRLRAELEKALAQVDELRRKSFSLRAAAYRRSPLRAAAG